MKFIITAILIFTCCFANATELKSKTYNLRFFILLKKFQAEKNLPRLDTVIGKEILSQFTDPKLIADLSKDKLEEQLNITNYIN
ncbi:hypothetical protein [Gilliamella sp. Nev3-1]|uniref:hypothetical protein n=1 Tax=Gilliamella sp. Nev3-1 TaxID=3120250 RepID=UPI00080EC27A|nr:hypothetical protein [Gilliamella apicola]OCG58591.1 hypothetical protein A9G40_08915 [Gilliamella apicola]